VVTQQPHLLLRYKILFMHVDLEAADFFDGTPYVALKDISKKIFFLNSTVHVRSFFL